MKTYFKSDELPHIWAHQSAPRGRCPSHLSFDGPLLLSYNTGIARLIGHKGKKGVLINSNSFSVTTSKHQGQMRRALPPDLPRFYVSESQRARLNHTGKEIFKFAIEKAACAKAEAEKTRKSRKKDRLLGEQSLWLTRAQEVASFFGLRNKVDQKAIDRLATAKVRAEKAAEKVRKEREAEQRKHWQSGYDAWKAGDPNAEQYFPAHLFPVAFRVEGSELVSTLGARVPLEDAKRAYRFATSKRGLAWRENGDKCEVGNYSLSSICPQGIVAGCHRISWEEIDRLASILS